MKKFIKMSLVAATAVAGLTSTASAGNLTEMIKNTKMTGYTRYRINSDYEAKTDMNEEAKAVAKFTTPVNDMVTSNVKIVGEAKTANALSNTGGASGDDHNENTTKAGLAVTEANFVVKAGKATVIAGLQTSQSPFFANNGDTRSHGFTALVPVGPATIAGAYYTTTVGGGLAKPAMTNNVLALGALTKFGNVNVNAWYAQVQDASDVSVGAENDGVALGGAALDDASAISLEVKAKAGNTNVQLMKTEVSNANSDTGITKLVAEGKAGNVSYMAAYAMTEKAGGMVALDKDTDSKADLGLDNISMSEAADADAFVIGAGMKANDKVSVNAAYLSGDAAGTDFNELDVTAKYQMSKNFYAKVLYATGDKLGTDFSYSQIEIKYSF